MKTSKTLCESRDVFGRRTVREREAAYLSLFIQVCFDISYKDILYNKGNIANVF